MKLATRDLLVEVLLESFAETVPVDAVRARAPTLTAQFSSEQAEVTEKLNRYLVALEEWRTAPQLSARETTLRKAALLFNHHLFFEVHEILEAQWRGEHAPSRLFLQGLIQVAVAFYHLERRNFRGAVSLLHDGLEKIMPYQPAFLGVELQEFVARLIACREELQRLGPEHCNQFQGTRIPLLQFQVD
jgi:predicted metal-dependent hydrolase